jgi:N-carbamoyl-L-amino-acid hydrolase
VCGRLDPGELDIRDAGGTSIAEALARLGLPAPVAGPLPGAFVELHIEQGTALAERGVPVGVVTEIVAMAGMTVRFTGERAHAGGTAMDRRRDGLVAAARFVLGARELAVADPRCRATVGELVVSDPAANVIPQEVTLTVDARARSDAALDRLLGGLRAAADRAAADSGCTGVAEVTWREPAVAMDAGVTGLLARASGGPGVTSWAGHDAEVLALAGVPTGMLFVRAGAAGVSHSPRESASEADIGAGIDALAESLTGLADSAPARPA